MRSGLIAPTLAALCLLLCGCGGDEAGSTTPPPTQAATPSSTPAGPQAATAAPASKLAQAQRTHEYPASTVPAETAASPAATAVLAIRAFADSYINWTAATVSNQMRTLATESIGQARSATALAAAQTAQDYELQRGGIANRGTVEAIAPLLGHRYVFVVVTRELTTATATNAYQGLRPAWHLALATVTQLSPGHWVLSAWQPEN